MAPSKSDAYEPASIAFFLQANDPAGPFARGWC
jgi:hypothetical protein